MNKIIQISSPSNNLPFLPLLSHIFGTDKKEEKNELLDSEDEYDDTINLYENPYNDSEEDNIIDINMKIETIDDLINIGKKFNSEKIINNSKNDIFDKDNYKKDKKDIVDAITDIYYYESVLQETIRASILYVDTGKSVQSDGKTKTILEGLPLVGQENTTIKMKDANGVELKLQLYVNKISPLKQDTTKSLVGLDLVSKEHILNEKIRLNCRFDGKISNHIRKILTDTKFLATQKNLDIEETANNFNFMGNNKKPFYSLVWLSKKSIPNTQNAKNNTAGFFFYQTKEGYKFKSIDNLITQSPKATYEYIEVNQSDVERQSDRNNFRILQYVIQRNQNLLEKLRLGTYSSFRAAFNPLDSKFTLPSKEIGRAHV